MKVASAVLFILLLFCLSHAQQGWTRTYGGTGWDYGYAVQQTTDGGFIVAGCTNSFGAGLQDIWLLKTDANGDTIWTRTYGGAHRDYVWSCKQTFDGGYILSGRTYSFGAGRYDVYLVKTDSLGDTLWTRTYGSPNNEFGYGVQQTSDGGYIVVGLDLGSTNIGDIWLIKTDTNGDTIWTRTYGEPDCSDCGYAVQQTYDGGYIIAGRTSSFGAGVEDVYLIKTNASGDTLWTRTYGGGYSDIGFSVQQTSDGGYIIAGQTLTSYVVYLIKTNALGDTLWTRTYDAFACGQSVQQTSDGGYIIAGHTYSHGAGWDDVYLIKTNASGDTLWTRTYGGTSYDCGYSVQQTSDGGYVIAGRTWSYGSGTYDVYLIKTNASGDTLWTRTYGGTNWDEGYSVQQTSDGGYIVTGYTYVGAPNWQDVWLIKTNASGDTLWTRTYGGTSGDVGNSIQQTTDGGYIIAGRTGSFGAGNYDVYLIKTDRDGNIGVEEESDQGARVKGPKYILIPNPFASFARIPGHEGERFNLYDLTGRQVGVYQGDRIGEGLSPGVYFLQAKEKNTMPTRVVKIH